MWTKGTVRPLPFGGLDIPAAEEDKEDTPDSGQAIDVDAIGLVWFEIAEGLPSTRACYSHSPNLG